LRIHRRPVEDYLGNTVGDLHAELLKVQFSLPLDLCGTVVGRAADRPLS
jgi:hypothetical protein